MGYRMLQLNKDAVRVNPIGEQACRPQLSRGLILLIRGSPGHCWWLGGIIMMFVPGITIQTPSVSRPDLLPVLVKV